MDRAAGLLASLRWVLPSILLALCALGCGQRKDPSIALLERENRHLEDLIWQWKDAYDEKVQELDATRRAYRSVRDLERSDDLPNPTMQPAASGRSSTPATPEGRNGPPDFTPPPRMAPPPPRPLGPPRVTRGRPQTEELPIPLIEAPPEEVPPPESATDAADLPDIEARRDSNIRPTAALIDLDDPRAPADAAYSAEDEGVAVAVARESRTQGEPTLADPPDELAAASAFETPLEPIAATAGDDSPAAAGGDPDPRSITHIVLDPRLTGGFDFDPRRAGHEGITVVIEPRNAADGYVPLAGDVSVVVLDPAENAEKARVARWDYDALEVSRHLRKSLLGRGIHFDLRWPDRAPAHAELRVVVRYITPDGRRLEAQRDLVIELPIDHGARWHAVAARPGRNGERREERREAEEEARGATERVAPADPMQPVPLEPALLPPAGSMKPIDSSEWQGLR